MKINKIHYISGLTISLFVGLHLFNHALSIWSIDLHIKMMNTLRLLYRNVFVETILLLSVLLQIISGLMLFKTSRKTANSQLERIHIWSGLYLTFFLIIHLSAVFVGRFFLKLDTNFYFAAVGINLFPLSLFFIPYYGLAIISVFGHLASIHSKKLKKNIFGLSPEKHSIVILNLGSLLSILIFYGFTNHFNGVTIPKEYKILFEKVFTAKD
jgi:uncharacterized membrane protein